VWTNIYQYRACGVIFFVLHRPPTSPEVNLDEAFTDNGGGQGNTHYTQIGGDNCDEATERGGWVEITNCVCSYVCFDLIILSIVLSNGKG